MLQSRAGCWYIQSVIEIQAPSEARLKLAVKVLSMLNTANDIRQSERNKFRLGFRPKN